MSVSRDLQRLLAVVRLRHQQIVHVHAELSRIDRIERVFRVDERRLPAHLLRFGDDMQRQRRLAARFRAVNFNHAPARHAAHAQRRVDRKRSGGDHADGHQHVAAAQTHDGALAVVFFDL